MRKIWITAIILLSVFILTACGDKETSGQGEGQEGKLKVYTTVYPLQFFAEQIGGETVDVSSILPPGSDAHTYEPTTKEMVEMAESDLFIYNGAGLEGYAEKISQAIEPEGVSILAAANGMDLEESAHTHEGDTHDGASEEADDHAHEAESGHEGHNHGEQDPHVWLDPVRSIEMAENIKDQLVDLNPEEKDRYEENFKELEGKLTDLDQSFHDTISSKDKKEIIVSHAAYGYWEEAYGIRQISVSGLSPTNEPSQKDLEKIVKEAKDHDLRYVIFEQNITPKVSEIIQKEIGAETLRFHNLAVLTEEDIEQDEDYFSLMNRNLDVLEKALTE
ncbi:zinc ABC transporter substrate-binding protein [Halobacillus sp. ACCC02827]|uniref:metal ABC transporter solute-binding protein, Zn/Mn family n=1 Tax=Bacillaceae TaxID=186817 RepID=UPI0002A512DA|nr:MULTISPECIES: zinc ABC transporter substrate-binding protein [Bacillaceae]ELK48904.1 zinc ABC transporter extracellular binding protein [Halobacillus sp. BAB-2008]QHT45768.1 zinc ABC transporter solute-binding protein [Bacillus sp. SB49]WJE16568.1 zinc ABC transporter substrate-binding protein [Halobacillus sp. ACCC02827]